MENIFETVLQRIENNPSICSNDITTKIENELREYSSTRLDEINHSNGSIQRKKYFLDLNYNEEIRLLDSNYNKEIRLLDSNYNKEIRLLDSNYNKEIQLLDSNYIKEIQNLLLQSNQNIVFAQKDYENKSDFSSQYKSGLESEYDRKCREVQSNMEWKKSSLEVEYDRKCREVQSSMERKKSDLKSKYDSEFSKAECFMTSKKLDYENKLKKLDQERNSIQHIRHECDQWKESGLDINYVFKVQDDSNHSSREYTLLHFAANFGDTNVTKLLFAEGAGVDVKDHNGNTPLHLSAVKGHIGIAELLVEKEAGLNAVNKVGDTPLHLSANNNHIEIVKLLVEKGANVDIKDQNEDTPLHLSAVNGNTNIVKLLVEKGADIHLVNKDGNTSLHLSAVKGHIGIAELLVEKGADLNVVNKVGDAPLHLSANNNHIEIVKLLVEKGANIDKKGHNENAPLHLFSANGNIEMVKFLVEKGADIHLVDKDGNTSLHSAFYKNYPKIVRYLTAKEPTMKVVVDSLVRCVVEDRTHTLLKGRTPLHLAAIYDCTEVVESLLAEGENPLLKDANGKTPRELATDESLIQLFGEAEIKQQEYNATKWGLVSGGSAAALGITVATTLFATAVFTVGLLPIVTAVAAVTTFALAVGGITYMILKPSATIERVESNVKQHTLKGSNVIEV